MDRQPETTDVADTSMSVVPCSAQACSLDGMLRVIYAAKKERRRRLAALPIEEKLRIIQFLHDEVMTLRRLKKTGGIKFIGPNDPKLTDRIRVIRAHETDSQP